MVRGILALALCQIIQQITGNQSWHNKIFMNWPKKKLYITKIRGLRAVYIVSS